MGLAARTGADITRRERGSVDREKVAQNLAILRTWVAVNPDYGFGLSVTDCRMAVKWLDDALELLKSQNEIIDDLIKVGYPHNFQREEPWIVNYMYAITDVIRKAVNLKNDAD